MIIYPYHTLNVDLANLANACKSTDMKGSADINNECTVYPKKYAHGFCFAVLCCGYTLTDFPISIRLTSLALWQSNDCPSASKATLMNMDKYFMWIHYERLHNHNKANHNKTVCIFLGIYCKQWHIDTVRGGVLEYTTGTDRMKHFNPCRAEYISVNVEYIYILIISHYLDGSCY